MKLRPASEDPARAHHQRRGAARRARAARPRACCGRTPRRAPAGRPPDRGARRPRRRRSRSRRARAGSRAPRRARASALGPVGVRAPRGRGLALAAVDVGHGGGVHDDAAGAASPSRKRASEVGVGDVELGQVAGRRDARSPAAQPAARESACPSCPRQPVMTQSRAHALRPQAPSSVSTQVGSFSLVLSRAAMRSASSRVASGPTRTRQRWSPAAAALGET